MTMAKSVKKHIENGKVIACIVEKKIPNLKKGLSAYFDEVIFAEDIGFENFPRFIFQYNQSQGSNACKAQLLIYLIKKYNNHNVFIFADSDTKVFSPFNGLNEYLKTSEIILSPHFIRFTKNDPLYHLGIVHKSGIFNTGFFVIKRGNESNRFLNWWADILLKYCYKETQKGLWNEQKWLDLIPALFDFDVLKDPGYNVGPWNFQERVLSINDKGEYLVNQKPLCLFHFSGIYCSYFSDRMNLMDNDIKKIIGELRNEYLRELDQVAHDLLKTGAWSYDHYINGYPIDKKSRLIFRNNPKLFRHLDNPFTMDDSYFRLSLEHKKKKQKSK